MLSDENDNFVRDYEIAAEYELTDFHKFIRSDLKFDASQMASFFRSSVMWEKEIEYTLLDMGMGEGEVPAMPMQGVKLSDVVSEPHDRLIYLFDIFGDRALYMELVEVLAVEAGAAYPRCTTSRGEAPDQFDAAAADDDSEGSIFDDVMSEFNDFEGDDSYNDD
jgi:hypothetical protein